MGYGAAVKDALVLWEASDRVCSKRLAPMIPVLLPALERHGQLAPDEGLWVKLLAISPATIDRLLSETRIAAAQGAQATGRLQLGGASFGAGAHLRGLG